MQKSDPYKWDLLDSVKGTILYGFAAVTTTPFEYLGVEITPRPLQVSTTIFRGYHCPPKCGACCVQCTLDWLPFERIPYRGDQVQKRWIPFDGRKVLVLTDFNDDVPGTRCRNLTEEGRCGIHGDHPMACDFAPTTMVLSSGSKPNFIRTTNFQKRELQTTVTGSCDVPCGVVPGFSEEDKKTAIRRFLRMQLWCTHFGIETCIPDIISWIKSGPHKNPLHLNERFRSKSESSVALPLL